MIQIIDINQSAFEWMDENKNRHQIHIDGGTYIYNEYSILYMDAKRENVSAYNEKGQLTRTLKNGDDIYLMYLQKHPRFGLCVVVSIKEDDNWKDIYLSFQNNEFIKVSNAR